MRFMVYGFLVFQALALGWMMSPYMIIEGGGNVRQWLPLIIAFVVAVPSIVFVSALVNKGPCKRCSAR